MAPLISYADQIGVYTTGGVNIANLKNNTSIQINNFVTNNYITEPNATISPILGIGIGYIFTNVDYRPLDLLFGIAAYYIKFSKIQGLERPFINSGIYDTLNYRFRAKSQSLMFEMLLFYKRSQTQPFLLLGIGRSRNTLHNYNEMATIPALSAAPVITVFSNHTQKTTYAYEVGLGVQRQVFKDEYSNWFLSLEYRYLSLGKGRLGNFPAQTANVQIHSNLFSNALTISVRVAICKLF